MTSLRVLLTTFGSLGDLHPFLSIGQELQRRGHRVTVGTQEVFRERVEAAGLAMHPVRAGVSAEPSAELVRQVFAGAAGVRYLVRDLVMPSLRLAYADTLLAAEGADLLVTHPLTFATPLIAEKRGIPWLSTQLAPHGLLSATDPPVLPGLGWLAPVRAAPALYRAIFRLADRQTRPWLRPVDHLRAELGLPAGGNPLINGGDSPGGVLALFSRVLASRQADWPPRVTVTGFPFFAQPRGREDALQHWLDAGPPPVVFTLGSAAVLEPGAFFTESVAAARRLGRRALLVGFVEGGVPAAVRRVALPGGGGRLGEDGQVYAAPYVAYAEVFPRAAAVVHQGGVGTTAEALRAGRPMLVVPFGVDQPDNAARVARLGVARVLPRSRYAAARAGAELQQLLGDPRYGERAETIAATVAGENGAAVAATAIEAAAMSHTRSV